MRFTDNSELTTANMATNDILAGTDVSANADKKFTLSGLAKWFLESYTGSTLGDASQSVQTAISKAGIGSFVTPQMYGAKADGTTNDATAIQNAINSGKHVFFPKGTYKITTSINLTNLDGYVLNASAADIVYSGGDYAFRLTHVTNSDFYFGTITASAGGCVGLYASSNSTYCQYVNIEFLQFAAVSTGNCIYADNTGAGWINEIRIAKGRFYSGANGCYIHHNGTNGISHWVFDKVGIEGVTNGIYMHTDSVAAAASKKISYISVIEARYAEATTFIKTSGQVWNVMIVDTYGINADKFDVTSDATNWTLYQSDGGAHMYNGGWTKYGANMWMNVSSAFTFDTTKVTSSTGFRAYYNPFTKQIMLGGNLTVALTSGNNDIATISTYTAYDAYYVGLPFFIEGKYCGSHITGRSKIRISMTEAFTGNMICGGSWYVA